MIVGGYALHLYCDAPNCQAGGGVGANAQIYDEHGSVCRKRARRAGWKLDLVAGKAVCPSCAKRPRDPERIP